MKKVLISLSIIAVAAAIVIGATTAYFSDTETSTGNTFTAGTIDIAINNENPWTHSYNIGELKPGEIGYINFDISNVGQNPVNITKNLSNFVNTGGVENYVCDTLSGNTSSEPECVEEIGTKKDDVQTQIIYDLSVKVYANGNDVTPIWWQEIYNANENKSLTDIYGTNGDQYVALGMIPVGGHMMVTQSYHFNANAGNEYQGDTLSFNITIKGDQLTGTDGYAEVSLENKTGPNAWDVILGDGIGATFRYKTQGPLFDFVVIGKAPLANHNYVLVIGYNASTDVDTEIGTAMSDSVGHIEFSGTVNTISMTNAKAWLVPAENWVGGAMGWTGWPASAANFLWETGLINYTKN